MTTLLRMRVQIDLISHRQVDIEIDRDAHPPFVVHADGTSSGGIPWHAIQTAAVEAAKAEYGGADEYELIGVPEKIRI